MRLHLAFDTSSDLSRCFAKRNPTRWACFYKYVPTGTNQSSLRKSGSGNHAWYHVFILSKVCSKKIHWNMRGLPHTQEKWTWVVHHSPLRCLPIPATPRCFSAPTLYKATTRTERERESGETPHCTIWTPSIGKFMSMEALLHCYCFKRWKYSSSLEFAKSFKKFLAVFIMVLWLPGESKPVRKVSTLMPIESFWITNHWIWGMLQLIL